MAKTTGVNPWMKPSNEREAHKAEQKTATVRSSDFYMTIDSGLFYLIIVVSVIHSGLVIVLDLLYLRLVRRYNGLKKEMVQIEADKDRQVNQILDEARHKSRSLVAEATNSAARVMSEAKLFTAASEDAFRGALEKATAEYEARYKEVLLQVQSETEQMLKNSTMEIKKPLSTQLDSFTTTFQKELAQIREETRAQIANFQKQTLAEVGHYKEQKLKEVGEVILELVRDIAREVIGREISPEKHEELVLKALEEAKRQKVF